jgi:putative ABC transport system permease protein
MTRHLLKLIWHRRRTNLLIMVEVLLSFLVLAAVVTMAVFYADNYRKPLGFVVDDVWTISIDTHADQVSRFISVDVESATTRRRTPAELLARIDSLMSVVREEPGVEAAAAAMVLPYGHSTWTSSEDINGREIDYGLNFGSDDFARVFGLELINGRWFDQTDNAAAGFEPVVINQRLARNIFGERDAVGATIPRDKPPESAEEARRNPPARVVGVIREFRKDGEFSPAANFMFHRITFTSADDDPAIPRAIVLRVRPGLRAGEFEEQLVKRLRAAAPEWSFEVQELVQARETALRTWLAPVVGAGVISGFLLLMVAMGLTGVLWLNVTQRTREIGLRRAKGATIKRIQWQIVAEVIVMTSLALAAGTVLIVQFPLLDLVGVISTKVYAVSLLISAACIFALSIGCAWAPSRMASRVVPAEALRYE